MGASAVRRRNSDVVASKRTNFVAIPTRGSPSEYIPTIRAARSLGVASRVERRAQAAPPLPEHPKASVE